MFPVLLALFFLVPLMEIYLLLQVGGVIGAGWTIFLVVFTAVLGAILVRSQGFAALNRIRAQLDAGEIPAMELAEGVFLLLAGALLLTPGFVTDALGFACLTPPLRRAVIRYAIRRGLIRTERPSPEEGARTLEGEFRRIDD